MWVPGRLSFSGFVTRGKSACVLLCCFQWIIDLVCSSQDSQHPSDSFHLTLSTQTLVFFPSFQCRSSIASLSPKIHNHPPHPQKSPPSHTFLLVLTMCSPPPPCFSPRDFLVTHNITLIHLYFLREVISFIVFQEWWRPIFFGCDLLLIENAQ